MKQKQGINRYNVMRDKWRSLVCHATQLELLNKLRSSVEPRWTKQQTVRITCPCNEDPLKSHFYIVKLGFTGVFIFLAHLSRRLTGELIGYPWIRRPSSSVVRPSVHIFKHLLLRKRLANRSQILCGASLERGNESLYKWSMSHDQDGRHAHIW